MDERNTLDGQSLGGQFSMNYHLPFRRLDRMQVNRTGYHQPVTGPAWGWVPLETYPQRPRFNEELWSARQGRPCR